MRKLTRQTPGKKPYKEPFKTYVINKHYTAYRAYKGRLWFYPIYENGSIDYSRGEIVEEAPEQFRSGHKIALIRLGVSCKDRLKKIINKITYY